ncbi:MAG: PASTA domain-containing protein [Bacilli bacterium]
MSLYDDYKKSENPVDNESSDVVLNQEVYGIVKDPIYKRKEFYILLSTILAIATVIGLLVYTPKFEMENLLGKNEEYAKTYSENYNLKLSVTKEFNDEYSKDQIYEQSLKAKKSYKEGGVLEVKISNGPDYDKVVSFPEFESMTYDEALEWKEENFAKGAKIVEEYSDSYEAGKYIKDDLDDSKKSNFKRNTEVTVTYSKGESATGDVVKVEDFEGKTTAEVANWAYKNNITLNVSEIFDKYLAPNVVIEQSVKAGEEIVKGSEFNITICVGEGVVVPNFYGLSKADALTAASTSKVTVTETSVYNASVPSGALISQSIGGGNRIKETDSVALVYSLGQVPINNYVGANYIDVVTAINSLNESGANITINIGAYVNNPEGLPSGSVASQTYPNKYVAPGTTITLNLYR